MGVRDTAAARALADVEWTEHFDDLDPHTQDRVLEHARIVVSAWLEAGPPVYEVDGREPTPGFCACSRPKLVRVEEADE